VRLIVLAAASLALAACGREAPAPPGADPERGRLLLRQFGCGTCHRIPGVPAARGGVGPPLDGLARRVYLAGLLPNTPANLARWIRAPQAIDPGTAMPDMQVGEDHARDMVAYLATLR
jgi:cytochrome c2